MAFKAAPAFLRGREAREEVGVAMKVLCCFLCQAQATTQHTSQRLPAVHLSLAIAVADAAQHTSLFINNYYS